MVKEKDPMKGKRIFGWWSVIGDMSMERKLLLVFLIIITLPLTFISVFTYKSYSESILGNTITYSEKLIDQMMDGVDDYIEDMKRISSMPAYVNDIKQNLIRSNHYHEQKEIMGGQSGSATLLPGDFDLLLSIQRGIEGNISFINNIKRGANTVYIFDAYGNGYYSAKDGGVRLDLDQSYNYWSQQTKDSTGEALLFGTQSFTSNLQSTRYAFTVVRKIVDGLLNPDDIGFFPFPYDNSDTHYAPINSDWFMGVSKYSKNKELAMAWLNFFVKETSYKDDWGFLPADGSLNPFMPQYQEFLSYKPKLLEATVQSDTFIDIANRAKLSFWSGDYIQELLAAPDLQKAFDELNAKWKEARAETQVASQP
jgi:hypothetical protein